MTRRVNQSELRCYKRCRRKWWLSFNRRLKLRETREYGNLSVGNAVHGALSLLELGTELDEVREILRWLYAVKLETQPQYVREINSEAELVRVMVEGFVEWGAETGLAQDLQIYATEALVEYPIEIAGEDVILHGTIDARVLRQSTGARLFREYKTVGDLTRPGHTLHMDEQHLFYQLLERLLLQAAMDEEGNVWTEFPPTEGSLHVMLRKVKRTAAAKPPFYGVMEVRHTDHELRAMWKRVVRTIKDIFFTEQLLNYGIDPVEACYPFPTKDCHWDCEFYPVCPMFDDATSDVEHVVTELYTTKEEGDDEVKHDGA